MLSAVEGEMKGAICTSRGSAHNPLGDGGRSIPERVSRASDV